MFAKDTVTFLRPAHAGEWLDVHWRIRDVYARKGRLYQALATEVTIADGATVLMREAHSVFFTRSGEPLSLPRATSDE